MADQGACPRLRALVNVSTELTRIIQGGPSLKILGAGLLRRQQELDVLDLRIRAAAHMHSAAQAILRGITPSTLYGAEELVPLGLVAAPEDFSADMSEC